MSLKNKLERHLNELITFNKLGHLEYNIIDKDVLDSDTMKKHYVYEVKIKYKNDKVLLDSLLVIFYYFLIRFKIYRTYINFKEKTFNFTLKLRNLEVIDDILRDI